jgi:DNA ligase-1
MSDVKAPALLLAKKWDDSIDPTGYWMSEKLDGMRAYWDGTKLLSRLGNLIHAPEWFTKTLPLFSLDGELWLGRKQFQKLIGIVRRNAPGPDWHEVTYRVFDAPRTPDIFEARKAVLEAYFLHSGGPASWHPHRQCVEPNHLVTELARVEALGGEGIMLRAPGSLYEGKRSSTLLKVKTFHDAEGTVIGHEAGKGKHLGRLGALRVTVPTEGPKDHCEFSVGSGFTDAEREAPPAIGSIITFRYQELTDGGTPRFPTFVRVREDL